MEDYTLDDLVSESDIAVDDTTSIAPSSAPSLRNPASQSLKRRKRPGRRTTNVIWSHCRNPDPGEPYSEGGRRIWYCKYPQCDSYTVLSTTGARNHMIKLHGVSLSDEEPTKAARRRNQDIRTVFGDQGVIQKTETSAVELAVLTTAAKLEKVRTALLRLVVLHDLPLNLVEWPQLHTLVYALNHCAGKTVFKSRSHLRRYIHENFLLKQAALKIELQHARSVIHLGTDTWHSPNRHELQGITAHFVDQRGKLRKALLAMPELFTGHGGDKVALKLLDVLERYNIKHKLGYVVGDKHGANDTLCKALSDDIEGFDAVQRRLRCFCHITNLAVQAFLYAENAAAVDYADELTVQSQLAIDEQVQALQRGNDTAGWINSSDACQKVLALCKTLRASDSRYQVHELYPVTVASLLPSIQLLLNMSCLLTTGNRLATR